MDELLRSIEHSRQVAKVTRGIPRRNRHNAVSGEWYGPDMEPQPAGPYCQCQGCKAHRYIDKIGFGKGGYG